jgi:hypothetical protein
MQYTKIMKRRNVVKQSIAGAIIAATPLALTGFVRAEGGGGTGSTSTDSTDWWDTTGTTNDSTDETGTTEFQSSDLYVEEDPCQFATQTFKSQEIHHLKDQITGEIISSFCIVEYECDTTPKQTCTKEVPCDNPTCSGEIA